MRLFLRQETNASHERVDQLYSELDLTDATDYETFLRCNLKALNRFSLDNLPKAVRDYVSEARALLHEDIALLGGAAEAAAEGDIEVDGRASLYVFGGAGFGQRVLQKRWSRSKDCHVLQAGNYLAHREAAALWSAFMRLCEEDILTQEQRYIIVYSSRAIFDAYAEAFLSSRQQHVALAAVG